MPFRHILDGFNQEDRVKKLSVIWCIGGSEDGFHIRITREPPGQSIDLVFAEIQPVTAAVLARLSRQQTTASGAEIERNANLYTVNSGKPKYRGAKGVKKIVSVRCDQ